MQSYHSADEAYQTALDLIDQEQMQQAEAILRELISRSPQEVRNHEALLRVLYKQRRIDHAVDHVQWLMVHFKVTQDPVYDRIYLDALRATGNTPLPLRRIRRFHLLVRQLERVLTLHGDVAECGCYRGMSSFLLCSYLRRHDAAFDGAGYHIFDSFQGLSEPTTEDDIPSEEPEAENLSRMIGAGHFAMALETVRQNLSAFPGITYHRGWIPLAFERVPERKYRFVHVDVDLYDPTWACLEYFYPRMLPGAIIVSDDHSWPGARKAIEEFCAEKEAAFSVTKYGQAIIGKTSRENL